MSGTTATELSADSRAGRSTPRVPTARALARIISSMRAIGASRVVPDEPVPEGSDAAPQRLLPRTAQLGQPAPWPRIAPTAR